MDSSEQRYPHLELTKRIIGAAYEVHKHLSFGFLEKVYASALFKELSDAGLSVTREAPIEVRYKGEVMGFYYADLFVQDSVICEIKALRALLPEHEAQLLHYLKATGTPVGLLLNFGARSVEVKRLIFSEQVRNT